MAKHGESSGQTNVHVPFSFTFANATDRAAGTGYTLVPADVGKFARQTDTNTIWMLTDDSPITWVAVGGGNSISTGTEAARPAPSNAGNLYFPNDGIWIERDSGALWAPWGPIYPLTPPNPADFSAVNFTGSVLTTAYGGLHIQSPSNGSAQSLRLQAKTLPASPYIITALIAVQLHWVNFSHAGIGLRASGVDDVVIFTFKNDGGNLNIALDTWTSGTSGGTGTYIGIVAANGFPWPYIWMRIQDDGVNRKFFYSVTGREGSFTQVHSVGRTDTLTPDQFCFGTNPFSQETAISLLSYKET